MLSKSSDSPQSVVGLVWGGEMNDEELISQLEAAWTEDGLFNPMRRGMFDSDQGDDFLRLMQSIVPHGQSIDRRIVRSLWFLPLFLEWQLWRFQEGNPSTLADFKVFSSRVLEQTQRILEMP